MNALRAAAPDILAANAADVAAAPDLSAAFKDRLTLTRTETGWHIAGVATRIPWARDAAAIAVLATTNPGLNDPADPQGFDTTVAAYLLFNPAFIAKDSADSEVDVMQHLTAAFPPAILFFGTKDGWKIGSDAALQKLKTLGNTTAELWTAEGQAHGFFRQGPWQSLTLSAADRFLVEHGFLKGNCTLTPPSDGTKLIKAP